MSKIFNILVTSTKVAPRIFQSQFNCKNSIGITNFHTNSPNRAEKKTTTAAGGVLGLGKGKKKLSKLGAMEKKQLPVETDPEKLVNYVCGSNIYTTGEDVKCVPLSAHDDQNAPLVVPNNDRGRFGRGENVTYDVLIYAHAKLATPHLKRWVVVIVDKISGILKTESIKDGDRGTYVFHAEREKLMFLQLMLNVPPQIKDDSEYPDWLWTLNTGKPPRIEDLDPNTKQYWIRVRAAGMRRNNKLRSMRKF